MSAVFRRRADVTDPDDRLAWYDSTGALRDLTGWTLSLVLVDPATNEVELDKVSGVVGSDGSGTSNVAIAWSAAEMGPRAGATRWRGRILAVNVAEKAEFVLDENNTLPVWIFDPVPTP